MKAGGSRDIFIQESLKSLSNLGQKKREEIFKIVLEKKMWMNSKKLSVKIKSSIFPTNLSI